MLRLAALILSCGLTAQEYTYRAYSRADGLPEDRVEQVVADSFGFVYARTAAGWSRFDGLEFEPIERPPETARDQIFLSDAELGQVAERYLGRTNYAGTTLLDLAEDAEGGRWFATADRGLLQELPAYFGPRELPGRRVTALLDYRDTLYVGTDGRGLYRRVGLQFEPVPGAAELEGLRITSLAADEGGLYIGTAGRGLFRWQRGRLSQLRDRDGLPGNWIRDVVTTGSTVYVLTVGGGAAEVIASDRGFGVVSGPAGELLSGNYERLLSGFGKPLFLGEAHLADLREDATVAAYGITAGLTDAAIRPDRELWTIREGREVAVTELSAKPYPTRHIAASTLPLRGPYTTIATAGAEEAVWIGGELGLLRVLPGEAPVVEAYADTEGWEDEGVTALVVAEDGAVWAGTANGLRRFVERNLAPGGPPPTRLEAVTLFYDTVAPGNTAFEANENQLGFRFRAVSLRYPERVRYRYRLQPEQDGWSPPTTERSVQFAGLAGGRYTFTVAASSDGGRTWGEPAAYTFTIDRPLWQRPWVLVIAVTLLATVLIGAGYLWHRRSATREAALRKELERQNAVLRLEQQARQLQMNPHFIFNALNGIRATVDDREARERLSRFASLLRGILHNSRQERISLAEEISTLEQYLEMERFVRPQPFQYAIIPPKGIDPEEISLPPMLLQPFVENALLHGFAGLDRPAELRITFSVSGRRCRVDISDNGVGRAEAARRAGERPIGHRSVGLEVTRERITAMGGTLRIADGEPYGTTVTVEIPVAHAW